MYHYNVENGYEYLNWNYNNYDDDYDEIATISDVDSNDPTVRFYDDYKIKHLKSIDKDHKMNLPSMDVCFESEVLPENCFQDIKSFYQDDQDVTGNEGVKCTKFYQCAAIMVFSRDDLLPILVKGYAKMSKIEEVFLTEFEKHKDNITDDNVKEKCLEWSQLIINRLWYMSGKFGENEMRKSKIFDNFLMLDNIEILQKFLEQENFEQMNLSYVHRMCDKYGWAAFSDIIKSKFMDLKSDPVRFATLKKFIDYKDSSEDSSHKDADKQIVTHKIMFEILKKFETQMKRPPRQKWNKYDQRTENTRKFYISFWPLANQVNYSSLAGHIKLKPMKVAVPILLSLAQNNENISDLWINVANHFVSEMETVLAKPTNPTFDWTQNVSLSCNCQHCRFVEDFLQRSYQQTLDFFGKEPSRNHVQHNLRQLTNLNIFTTKNGVLRIRKVKKTGEIESEERKFVLDNLPKLRSVINKI